jgi:endonuclease YncB( thermonuclease family)
VARTWTELETVPFDTAWRAARVERVVDADTLDLLVSLGFDCWSKARVRLLAADGLGVDAWETKGEERERGIAAWDYVTQLLPVGTVVRVFSRKGGMREKFGRWLAIVARRALTPTKPDETASWEWRSLGDDLVDAGHATRVDYS